MRRNLYYGSAEHPWQGRCDWQLGLRHCLYRFLVFGVTSILSLVLGVVGLVLASNSKKAGFDGGLRTAGFVLSIIGTVFGALIFVSCIACAGVLGAAGGLSALSGY